MPERKPLQPVDYQRVFEGDPLGARILEELVERFCRDPYVKGGTEAERETLVRIGERRPIEFLLRKINQANGADNDEQSPE